MNNYLKQIIFLLFLVNLYTPKESTAQNLIEVSKVVDKSSYYNDSLLILRGNLIQRDSLLKHLFYKQPTLEFNVVNNVFPYYFFSKSKGTGWLIYDKKINVVCYIGHEELVVIDLKTSYRLYQKMINCGLDVLTFKPSFCGFSSPLYDFENSILHYTDKKKMWLKRKKKISLTTLTN